VLHRVEEKLATLPGVESVTLSREALLAQSGSNSDFLLEGQPKIIGRKESAPYNSVGRSFFATMGIPILYGRAFNLRDSASSPGVAVINQASAEKEFPGADPIGVSFRMKAGGKQFQIVGVCADAKYAWIRDDDSPAFYVLYTQEEEPRPNMTFEVRTKGNPKEFATAARSAVESIDKDLPLIDVRTQEEQIDAALASSEASLS
jgi:MacB-like periplasmic core domain